MHDDNETITRQAIGRHGFIGSLYDVRTDRFEGRNLFNRELPSSYISTEDCAFTTYIVDENESQKDTFKKLNIDGSLKINLMAGLLKVEGSAKYLQQTKMDSRTVRVTHILHMKTKTQLLKISMADLCEYFTSNALENPNVTHCVIGITWGANVAATFEETLMSEEAAKEVQGLLSAALKKPTIDLSGGKLATNDSSGEKNPTNDPSVESKLEYTNKNNSKLRSLKISFSGDVLIKDVPHTVEDVFKIFKAVPGELETLNGGKGQQIEFELYPLKRIAENFKYQITIQRTIKNVSMQLMNRLEDIFEQIIRSKRMINDFLDKVSPWKDWLPSDWIEAIVAKQSDLKVIQTDTLHQLSTVLGQLRRGECEDAQLIKILDDFEKNNECSVKSVRKYLKENSRNDVKIESWNEICQHLKEAKGETKESTQHDLNLLFPKDTTIKNFINRHHNDHVYLLHISNEWKERDSQNWYKQIRTFGSTYKAQIQNLTGKPVFRIIDHDLIVDLDGKPDKCVIYHAYQGKVDSEDYYHASLVTLTEDQIRKIRSENKLSAISSKDIKALHKEFIAAHPAGEIDEDGFVNEFKQRFPKGDPKQYCSYAFKVLDRNGSGTLSFDEYMTAISLTLPGDIERQLALTFQMCAFSDQEHVSSEDLLQVLEAVAELKGIDSASTSLIAKTIMKFGDREQVEGITKEKFIDRLKANYDMCVSFLPVEVVPIQHNIKVDEQLLFVGGTLLSDKQHQLKLNEFYGNRNQKWKLIYKAVEHGFSAANFHSYCDGQGPTMTIIQSEEGNYLFGAFTQLVWSHNRGFRQDTNAFLFTLTNPHDLPPTKFNIDKSKSDTAVYHPGAGYLGELYDFYLFGFGGDGLNWSNFIDSYDSTWGTRRGDLFIASDCNKSSYSTTRFPRSYTDSCGFGDTTFTGTTNFIISDIEVYTFKEK